MYFQKPSLFEVNNVNIIRKTDGDELAFCIENIILTTNTKPTPITA